MAQDAPLDYNAVRAENALHDGVTLFQNGLYNRAILEFEKALSFKPERADIRQWLGEALYSSGLVSQALDEWDHVLKSGGSHELLQSRVDVIKARRSLDAQTKRPDRYLPLYELNGQRKDTTGRALFLRPSAVRPLPDGGFLVAAFGSEDVIQFNANGDLTRRFIGNVGRLRAPFDILPFRGRYYVSEFTTDDVAILGQNGLTIKTFGGTGLGDGQFLGPQFLATDGEAIYVSDWGNARVSKFDPDGKFLLSFGPATVGFNGLKQPTGIAATADTVYVADKAKRAVYAFDTSGNWLNTYGKDRFQAPEGLSLMPDGRLLVADGPKVWILDPSQGTLTPFDPEWNQGLNVTDAVIDANHDLVLADFDANKIRILAEGHMIYSGLFVRVIRIDTRNYPQVSVWFSVEDRWGRPVTGLDLSNLVLSESQTRIVDPQIEFQGYRSQGAEVALLIDRDPSMADYDDAVHQTVGFFSKAWADKGGIWLYAAGKNPVLQNQRLSSISDNETAASDPSTLTSNGKIDLGIRLAAESMIPSLLKRTVVYVTSGNLPPNAFGHYSLNETADFLKNNNIVFSVVSVSENPLPPEIQYLVTATGGKVYSSSGDLRAFLEDQSNRVSDLYALRWTSITPRENGLRAIPVSVEVSRFGKESGRGRLDFFAPR
jgi:tetratricopeptide (TPR) repeat protein